MSEFIAKTIIEQFKDSFDLFFVFRRLIVNNDVFKTVIPFHEICWYFNIFSKNKNNYFSEFSKKSSLAVYLDFVFVQQIFCSFTYGLCRERERVALQSLSTHYPIPFIFPLSFLFFLFFSPFSEWILY